MLHKFSFLSIDARLSAVQYLSLRDSMHCLRRRAAVHLPQFESVKLHSANWHLHCPGRCHAFNSICCRHGRHYSILVMLRPAVCLWTIFWCLLGSLLRSQRKTTKELHRNLHDEPWRLRPSLKRPQTNHYALLANWCHHFWSTLNRQFDLGHG